MLSKKMIPAAVTTALMVGAAAQAQAEISGNVSLVSDYRFRGISQSNENPAIQGGFDWAHDSGFYLGTWGSSVNFDSTTDFNGSLELDLYGGWGTDIGDNSNIDLGYIYYAYPGDDNGIEGDYQEIYINYGFYGFSVGAAYSDEYYGESGEFLYLQANYDWEFAENWALSLHVGFNQFDEDIFLSSDKGDYVEYSAGISWSVGGVDLGATYHGTDLDKGDVFGTDWAEDTLVISISKSM